LGFEINQSEHRNTTKELNEEESPMIEEKIKSDEISCAPIPPERRGPYEHFPTPDDRKRMGSHYLGYP